MNGNTTWGTAQPNGKVKVDQWLDGSSAPAFSSAGVLTGANIVPVPNSLQADIGGIAGTDDFVYAKNTQSDGVVLGNHVATPTRITLTAPGTSGQSQVFTVLVWKSASIVGTSQNGVEEVSKPIFVAGTPAATGSQTAPTDSQIRSALGATPNDFIGPIADITIANGQTVLLMSSVVRRQSTIPVSAIDLPPLYSAYGTLAAQTLTTSWVTNTSVAIPSTIKPNTKIEINVSVEFNNGGGGLKDMTVSIAKNGTEIAVRYTGAVSGIYFVAASLVIITTVQPNDIIEIRARKSNTEAGGNLVDRSTYTIKEIR